MWTGLVVLVGVAPSVVLLFAPDLPRWGVMWLIAFAIYAGCKWITWCDAAAKRPLGGRDIGYLFGWPGMDARAFLARSQHVRRPTAIEWLFAVAKLLTGVVLLYVVARRVPSQHEYLIGFVGMAGVLFVLHFGLFHILSCAWRTAGVNAQPLMNWPISSTSVSELWGRRWNMAFRDVMHRFLFRPLLPRLGATRALLAGFAASGLVHDLVMSPPASGGYGGPTLYFVLQAVAILFERGRTGRSLGISAGWRGRAFAIAVLLIPLPLLFHRPFAVRIIVPFLRAIGAL